MVKCVAHYAFCIEAKSFCISNNPSLALGIQESHIRTMNTYEMITYVWRHAYQE